MKQEIYNIVEASDNYAGRLYNCFMICVIIISLVPLMLRESNVYITIAEWITTAIFIVDYVCRWITADIHLNEGRKSFAHYLYTPWAIVDLLSILPSFALFGGSWFVTLKLLRISRLLRIVRVFKFFRYSEKLNTFLIVLKKEKTILLAVLIIAVLYIFVTAIIMFNVEPAINPETGRVTFKSFFDALYWATVTLTTVGYGDLTPATEAGRLISMLSSLFGVAIIALPSGVITASYMEELRKNK